MIHLETDDEMSPLWLFVVAAMAMCVLGYVWTVV